MAGVRRWDPCISHRDADADAFIGEYFASSNRRVVLIAGAGFDPRSAVVATKLAAASPSLRGLLIQENRPSPSQELVKRALTNAQALSAAISNPKVLPIDIFGTDNAVLGGRNAIASLGAQDFDGITDLVIDISALSVGTSFPIIRYFAERAASGSDPLNIHLFVSHDPKLDSDIRSIPGDAPGFVHGFKGRSTLDESASAAKLWLPQLASGRRNALNRLHDFVAPHDTCPILPFPASNPRLGDLLAEEYLVELENGWSVDTRNIVYADESDPLDLYRTILRLDDRRQPVFAGAGGSFLVLSPLGSKVMALGALMAALERDLPVAHLEPIGYTLAAAIPQQIAEPSLIHVWLEGEAYPAPRPALY